MYIGIATILNRYHFRDAGVWIHPCMQLNKPGGSVSTPQQLEGRDGGSKSGGCEGSPPTFMIHEGSTQQQELPGIHQIDWSRIFQKHRPTPNHHPQTTKQTNKISR